MLFDVKVSAVTVPLALILPEAVMWLPKCPVPVALKFSLEIILPSTFKSVTPLPLNFNEPVICASPLWVPSHSAVIPVNDEPSPENVVASTLPNEAVEVTLLLICVLAVIGPVNDVFPIIVCVSATALPKTEFPSTFKSILAVIRLNTTSEVVVTFWFILYNS